ncbi:hypothetical protein Tco_1553500 [Tanacetum coccineum]
MLSVEVEYIVVSEVAQVAYWMKKFIKELGVVPSIENPMKVYCNNSSIVLLANECITHIGSGHILRRHHYICEGARLDCESKITSFDIPMDWYYTLYGSVRWARNVASIELPNTFHLAH